MRSLFREAEGSSSDSDRMTGRIESPSKKFGDPLFTVAVAPNIRGNATTRVPEMKCEVPPPFDRTVRDTGNPPRPARAMSRYEPPAPDPAALPLSTYP